MKGLAKIGLIIAAAATVFLIFIFEVYKPTMSNETMSAAPEQSVEGTPQNLLDASVEEVETPPEEEATTTTDPVAEPETTVSPIEEETTAATTENTEVAPLNAPEVATRRIYGKITLAGSGENLSGVNIMIPGSNVAKVSNNNGGYTIEVPIGTRELIFIYRGKKLVQRIGGSNTLLNVRLDLESMQYD